MAVVRMPDPPRDLAAVVEQRSGLLNVQNLIQLTGFKKTAIYDMVADGRIPYLRFDSTPSPSRTGCASIPCPWRLNREGPGSTGPSHHSIFRFSLSWISLALAGRK